jgi:PhnB protein
MQLIPYLTFDGQCAEAFKFYERVLGGKLETLITHEESPMKDQVPPEWGDRIMHAYLTVGDAKLMGSDSPPEFFTKPQGLSVSINLDDVARGERIFKELSAGGTVTMPFEKTFWAERFGMLVDRFGTPWMINAGQIA